MDMNEQNNKDREVMDSLGIDETRVPSEGPSLESSQNDALELARSEAEEWRDKYVRALAEFDNFRKRTRAEIELLRDSVAESLLLNLLTVYDDMNRTLENANADEASLRRGVELIQQKFKNYLESQRITKLECRGKVFNPEEHDAIMMQPRAGFPANVVLEEVTPGYRLGERVIRHAQVIVSCEPEDEQQEEEGQA